MKIISICLLFFSLFVSISCTSKHTTLEIFEEEQLGKIQSGKTTKQEILQWFGPPKATARKGDDRRVPPPYHTRAEDTGMVKFALVFDTFSSRHEITDYHIIYYYRDLETETSFFVMGFRKYKCFIKNKLWILINDKTGIVEDYILQRYGENSKNY